MLFLECQNNDIEKCLVLFPICQIRFNNLPNFNEPFFPVEMGNFLEKASFGNLQK